MNFNSNSLQLFPDSVRETLQSILSITAPIGYLIIAIIMKKLKAIYNKIHIGKEINVAPLQVRSNYHETPQ